MRVRSARVAGSFYAGTREELWQQIKRCYTHRLGPGKVPSVTEGPRNIIGLLCPHAGYLYSGPVAAHAYYALAKDGKPDIIVILGPNHTGEGAMLSIMNGGVWQTPLGDVHIDGETATKIVKASAIIDVDEKAHLYEHSIEVQLPFLQDLYKSDFTFIPICFLMQDLESCVEVGEAIATVLKGKNALIIASSDMTHYEPQEIAHQKDTRALDALKTLDENSFFSIIEQYHITSCGYGPVVALIVASKILGANQSDILCYKTSGDVTGDYSAVVGYASVALTNARTST